MQVNIYIETDPSLRCSEKMYGYVLECKIRGEPITREGFGETTGTRNGATMQATAEALSRLTKPCEVTIYTQNTFIKNMYGVCLKDWAEKDFCNSQGKEIANRELWERIWNESKQHDIKIISGKHGFSEWLTESMNRRRI